jgi:hypothetical protein
VQAMFTEWEYDLLQQHAKEMNVPVGTLVRETVQKVLIAGLEQRRKEKALEWMAAQHMPVDDWEIMEDQLESRWKECEDKWRLHFDHVDEIERIDPRDLSSK